MFACELICGLRGSFDSAVGTVCVFGWWFVGCSVAVVLVLAVLVSVVCGFLIC